MLFIRNRSFSRCIFCALVPISIPQSHLLLFSRSSCVRHFATPWTEACQAPLSMRFSRQEYWSGLPYPSPGDLPGPEIKPGCPAWQADSLPSEPQGKPIMAYMEKKNLEKNRPFPRTFRKKVSPARS